MFFAVLYTTVVHNNRHMHFVVFAFVTLMVVVPSVLAYIRKEIG